MIPVAEPVVWEDVGVETLLEVVDIVVIDFEDEMELTVKLVDVDDLEVLPTELLVVGGIDLVVVELELGLLIVENTDDESCLMVVVDDLLDDTSPWTSLQLISFFHLSK